jgi:hypothetical protein
MLADIYDLWGPFIIVAGMIAVVLFLAAAVWWSIQLIRAQKKKDKQ